MLSFIFTFLHCSYNIYITIDINIILCIGFISETLQYNNEMTTELISLNVLSKINAMLIKHM